MEGIPRLSMSRQVVHWYGTDRVSFCAKNGPRLYYNNLMRGGNPNPRYGNAGGGGYKHGQDERDGHGEQRNVDRAKVRRDMDEGTMGAGGASHCFNYNRDDHFQASCLTPPSATAVRRMAIDLLHAHTT
jgi:hypothetical protein